MADYNEYLAVNVLNEQQYISYRNLSRALKVHCNLAKQMLYDFHKKQNSKKPGSVHATYILTGTKCKTSTATDGSSQDNAQDSTMQSSPPLPSSSVPRPDQPQEEAVPIRSVMLAKEEHLDQAKATFDTITGIHVYSLQAKGINDLQALTDCTRRVDLVQQSQDPLTDWKQYGTIQNPDVRRRSGKRPAPTVPPTTSKLNDVKVQATEKAAIRSSAAEVAAANQTPVEEAKPATTSKHLSNKPSNTGIFKAFAKASGKSNRTEQQESAKAPAADVPAEDTPMTGFSDDDEDDNDAAGSGLPEELNDSKAPSGKSRNDRRAELEAMMDQEDEEMEDVATLTEDGDEKHDEGAIDTNDSQPKPEQAENVVVENGRRRGRRRVMKKKTVKDEDGYIVTREEPDWESFSEDEPIPKRTKPEALTGTKPIVSNKKGAKPGQGNIMSFFSKK